jgi:hypothetical protein
MIADNRPSRVFHMHIAKAAGTSVNDFFAAAYGQSACAFHLESHPDVLSQLNLPAYEFLRVASGHLRLPHIKSVVSGGDWQIATCLRDPVDHLLSHLRWVKHIGNPESKQLREQHSPEIQEIAMRLHKIALDDVASVERFIFYGHAEALQLFDNCQTRYLIPPQKDRLSPMHADLAIRNLADVDFVFAVEQAAQALPAVLRALGRQLDGAPEVPRSNKGPYREVVDLNDRRVADFYRQIVLFDARLFVEAKRRGEALLGRPGRLRSGA